MAQPLTDAINALTTYANTVTGASDTTLSDAVATLASGYGGGGISVDGLATNTAPSGAVTLSSSVTTIGTLAFAYKPITSISAPAVTNVGDNAFRNTLITNISDADFPHLYETSGTWMTNAFSNMPELLTIKLSGYMSFQSGNGVLQNCHKLTRAEFPNANTNGIGAAGFRGNTLLEIIDIGNAGIGSNCFNRCNALRTLIIRRTDAVVALGAWTSAVMGGIYNNPTASTIYVPSALISSYQTANKWSSAYSAGVTFSAIEGSIYE